MSTTETEKTCEARIGERMASRLAYMLAGQLLCGLGDGDEWTKAHDEAADLLELDDDRNATYSVEADDSGEDATTLYIWASDSLNDDVRQRLSELPLGISSQTVFRVDLSTGGPGDWLEVVCGGDTPRYEPERGDGCHYEIERIVYHFDDWFDHAERELDGADFATAEQFVCGVVPELCE